MPLQTGLFVYSKVNLTAFSRTYSQISTHRIAALIAVKKEGFGQVCLAMLNLLLLHNYFKVCKPIFLYT